MQFVPQALRRLDESLAPDQHPTRVQSVQHTAEYPAALPGNCCTTATQCPVWQSAGLRPVREARVDKCAMPFHPTGTEGDFQQVIENRPVRRHRLRSGARSVSGRELGDRALSTGCALVLRRLVRTSKPRESQFLRRGALATSPSGERHPRTNLHEHSSSAQCSAADTEGSRRKAGRSCLGADAKRSSHVCTRSTAPSCARD